MLNPLINFFIFLSALIFLNPLLASVGTEKEFLRWKDEYRRSMNRYLTKHCGPKKEKTYEELLKKYRGLGFYVPTIDGKADVVTIRNLLPEIEKKYAWIKKQKEVVVNYKTWPDPKKMGSKIEGMIYDLLKLKKDHFLETDPLKKARRVQESIVGIRALEKEYLHLTRNLSFLLSYGFPVDHLKNRKIYDDFKDQQDLSSVTIANYAFFYRKIMEDGAYDQDHTKPDIFLRSTIDTLWFEFDFKPHFLEEDLRVDLIWVLGRMRKEIEKGQEKILERLTEWEDRTARHLEFYRDLVNPSSVIDSQRIISNHNQATIQLKKFVAEFQKDAYLFWRSKSDVMKTLFVTETILINEVGNVDGPEALERRDVAQIVYNRRSDKKYNYLDKDQDLYLLLKEHLTDEEILNEDWLNVLFKKGEFSFTYAYIPGVIKIVCPDRSKNAKKLLDENLNIALSTMISPRNDFTPLRYFSRASMLGRINMGSVWENFNKYPERAGLLEDGQAKLLEKFNKNEYHFLYSFIDPMNEEYWAILIDEKIYVMRHFVDRVIFYKYRTPHDFTYFSPLLIPE